jgi:hypothetical protein
MNTVPESSYSQKESDCVPQNSHGRIQEEIANSSVAEVIARLREYFTVDSRYCRSAKTC